MPQERKQSGALHVEEWAVPDRHSLNLFLLTFSWCSIDGLLCVFLRMNISVWHMKGKEIYIYI